MKKTVFDENTYKYREEGNGCYTENVGLRKKQIYLGQGHQRYALFQHD